MRPRGGLDPLVRRPPPPRLTIAWPSRAISERKMPSRMPRSATPSCSAGQMSRIASRIAQPATTRSARSRADARQAERSVKVHSGDHRADLPHRLDRHVQPVDRAAVVARQREMDAGERRHRAAGAEQADVGRVAGEHVGEAGEGVARALAHPVVGGEPVLALDRRAALALGQRHDAPRRAPPAADPRRVLALLDQHQLGRAAADVEDQRRAVAGLEQFVAAEHRQPRFLLRRR